MPGLSEFEYRQKAHEFDDEFINKFYNESTSENEKMILVLKRLDWNIRPYSFYWRCGYKKYIKKAIKIIEKAIKEKEDGN